MKHLISIILSLWVFTGLKAQFIFPEKIERNHPRLISSGVNKVLLLRQIESSVEVKSGFESLKKGIANFVEQFESDPEWMVSRMQMYWKSRATDIFIKGEYYSHAEGNAPVPTVRFSGSRDYVISYKTPKLEEIKPYLDDERGLWLQNKNTNNWEWVEQSKTGRIIESINSEIIGYARDAALVYFIEGDEKYAKFAARLFDVFMQGIYYRKAPYDLEQGHMQYLVGYTSFQVLKEGILDDLASCYDYLYDYLDENSKDKMSIYSESFKKMADQIIKNGVPFNNWNLYEADHVIKVAMILENDSEYKDGRGFHQYLDRIFNHTEERQWSMKDLIAYGYDPHLGIWNECPGYSIGVARDFTSLVSEMQDLLGIDILPYLPVIPQAVRFLPQYLFPNKYIVGFGDTNYGELDSKAMYDLVGNAQKFGKPDQEKEFTAMAKMLNAFNPAKRERRSRNAFLTLLSGAAIELDKSIPAANLNDYITNTLYAPTVSWLAQRNGFDEKHGLMISQAGSLGNHMHSNGIAMELYGKGLVLGPEGGRGSSYFQPDYLDYYSQFPAHNTVCVNGISKYPEMTSDHPFEVKALYPQSERKSGFFPDITFSELYFLEPKTNADQNRTMSIVRTGETSGYYVDIFRSKCKNGDDKYHDYFYHNLGQELSITYANNEEPKFTPTERLSSKDGDLKAYDYITDKQSVKTDKDFKATYKLSIDGEEETQMNMWMKGDPGRELFKVKSPESEAFRNAMIPDEIAKLPLWTTVVRQSGEAWNHPFVAIYEPTTKSEPSTIRSIQSFQAKGASDAFVGLKIESLSGRTDYIFSSDKSQSSTYQEIVFDGNYGVITNENSKTTLFLGSGTKLAKGNLNLEMSGKENGSAALSIGNNGLFLAADSPVTINFPDTFEPGKLSISIGSNTIPGKRIEKENIKLVEFQIPAISWQQLNIKIEK